jgi:hypothetical protein
MLIERRRGDPYELLGPVLLLASEAGSYISGTGLIVDGSATVRALSVFERRRSESLRAAPSTTMLRSQHVDASAAYFSRHWNHLVRE